MRVLQVLSSTNINSGIANVVMNYYRNIDREEVQFDCLVFSQAPDNFDSEISELGGKIYHFTQPGLKTYTKSQKELEEFFKEHGKEYDIIHCHEILVAKMVFKYARKYGNVKCISHSHSVKLSDKLIRAIRNRFIIMRLKQKSDYCFACSRKAGQTAFGKNIKNDKKFFVLVNAINVDKYRFSSDDRRNVREELSIDDKFVLGNIGRLSAEKNQKFAIDVLNAILSKGKDAVLLLVGKGGIENKLKEYARGYEIQDKVIFTGIRKDIPQILSAMDFFVFPSKFEGFGITLLEAQASGLNCLCFENMPEEIKSTDKLRCISKKSKSKQWADIILDTEKPNNREMYCEELKEKGYDIKEQANNLKDLYFKIKEDNI